MNPGTIEPGPLAIMDVKTIRCDQWRMALHARGLLPDLSASCQVVREVQRHLFGPGTFRHQPHQDGTDYYTFRELEPGLHLAAMMLFRWLDLNPQQTLRETMQKLGYVGGGQIAPFVDPRGVRHEHLFDRFVMSWERMRSVIQAFNIHFSKNAFCWGTAPAFLRITQEIKRLSEYERYFIAYRWFGNERGELPQLEGFRDLFLVQPTINDFLRNL